MPRQDRMPAPDPFRETTHRLHMQPTPTERREVQLGNITCATDQVSTTSTAYDC